MAPQFGSIIKDLWQAGAPLREEAGDRLRNLTMPMVEYIGQSNAGKAGLKALSQYYPLEKKLVENSVAAEKLKPEHLQKKIDVLKTEAANTAREHIFGKDNIALAGLVTSARKEKGDHYAQNFADHFAMIFKDNQILRSIKKNKEYPQPDKFKTRDVYTPAGLLEKKILNWNSTVLAPLIFLPHLSNIVNLAPSTPLGALTKGIAKALVPESGANTKAFLQTTGIYSDLVAGAYAERMAYRNGAIAKLTGSPTLGYVLNKIIHAPLFDMVREATITGAGAAGWMNAKEMAYRYALNGDKRAAVELEEMGLNLAEVKAQKGILNEEQLGHAIYEFVDNKVFLDNVIHRSYYSGSSMTFRVAGMFHGFVTREKQLIQHEFMKAAKSGDIALIAQTMGTLAVVFPMVGEVMGQLENVARGQDTDFKESMNKLSGREGLSGFGQEYISALAHYGSFGIWTSYVQSSARRHLAEAMLGSTGSVIANLSMDAVAPAIQEYQYRTETGNRTTHGNFKPLARDVLKATLPLNIGKIIANRTLPTSAVAKKREEAAGTASYKKYAWKKKTRNTYNKNAWKKGE